MSRNLFIRVDASAQIGLGHAMRCLALAQAWQDAGGSVVFAMAVGNEVMADLLRSEHMDLTLLDADPGSLDDAQVTVSRAQEAGAEWIVVDGYHFDGHYQRVLKESGSRLLCIDDNGKLDHYFADLVLNQNIHADESLYQDREPYTRLLLGTRYVLLRREFLKWQGWQRVVPEMACRVLVTMGGSDPAGATAQVLRVLQRCRGKKIGVRLIAGIANPRSVELEAIAAHTGEWIQFEPHVADMASTLAWADVALSAAGSTCWEMLFMQLPGLLVSTTASAAPVLKSLTQHGPFRALPLDESSAAADALTELLENADERRRMSACGRQIVDGLGVKRVLGAMLK